jgi:hypothetical protein
MQSDSLQAAAILTEIYFKIASPQSISTAKPGEEKNKEIQEKIMAIYFQFLHQVEGHPNR